MVYRVREYSLFLPGLDLETVLRGGDVAAERRQMWQSNWFRFPYKRSQGTFPAYRLNPSLPGLPYKRSQGTSPAYRLNPSLPGLAFGCLTRNLTLDFSNSLCLLRLVKRSAYEKSGYIRSGQKRSAHKWTRMHNVQDTKGPGLKRSWI
jgi:hypothetical protein